MKKIIGIKILPILLVLSILISLTSCMAFWVEQVGYDKMFEYTEVEGGYEIKGTPLVGAVMLSKKKFENMILEIPSEYNGKPIVAIAEDGFSGNPYLNKVIIPDTVKVIGNRAFSDCITLFECDIPGSVSIIGDAAFMNCPYLDVEIPEGVTTIGVEAFYYTMVYNEEGLFPDNFDFMMDTSIFVRTELKEMKIPSTVTSIGEGAFARSTLIVGFDVDENNPMYQSVDGVLYSKDGRNLLQYPLASTSTNCDVLDSVENIANYAFAEANYLETINISENSNLKRVGDFAFKSCDVLESLTFPATLESIGEEAIAYCDKLITCSINSSYVVFGDNLWEYSSNLTDFYYGGTVNQMKQYLDTQNFGYFMNGSCNIHCSDGSFTFLNGSYIILPTIPSTTN